MWLSAFLLLSKSILSSIRLVLDQLDGISISNRERKLKVPYCTVSGSEAKGTVLYRPSVVVLGVY
jgi:hypothetical protein